MNNKIITFKNKKDFQNRIAALFQDQNEDECYEFVFPDQKTEDEFEYLCECFNKGNLRV